MEQDWDAVAKAMRSRLDELGMNLTELATRSQVSLSTVRELVQNLKPRRRHSRTLQALSEALGWPADYLGQVLRGQDARPHDVETTDPVLRALTEIQAALRSLSDRVSSLEARYPDEPKRP